MTIAELPENKEIVLFDGVCNLCNSSVQYIIKHDENDIFRFVSLQSELGQEITKHIGVSIAKVDSIILYKPGIAYYIKAQAALNIAKRLTGWISMVSVFKVFPDALTNFVYDYIAKNRYKWYGKKDQCMIPTPELKAKFLL